MNKHAVHATLNNLKHSATFKVKFTHPDAEPYEATIRTYGSGNSQSHINKGESTRNKEPKEKVFRPHQEPEEDETHHRRGKGGKKANRSDMHEHVELEARRKHEDEQSDLFERMHIQNKRHRRARDSGEQPDEDPSGSEPD